MADLLPTRDKLAQGAHLHLAKIQDGPENPDTRDDKTLKEAVECQKIKMQHDKCKTTVQSPFQYPAKPGVLSYRSFE